LSLQNQLTAALSSLRGEEVANLQAEVALSQR